MELLFINCQLKTNYNINHQIKIQKIIMNDFQDKLYNNSKIFTQLVLHSEIVKTHFPNLNIFALLHSVCSAPFSFYYPYISPLCLGPIQYNQ